MAIVTDSQLNGNWAEQFIASQLAAGGCLVRHVTQGHDVGIDLYCELTLKGIPFLHFWCQVKTSTRWKESSSQIIYSANKREREYWLSQPVPVFLFAVPSKAKAQNYPYYICSTMDLLNSKKLPSCVYVKSAGDLQAFLHDTVVAHTFLWDLKNGKVSSLRTPRPGYFVTIPDGVSQRFEKPLFTSIRRTISRLFQDILFEGKPSFNVMSDPAMRHAASSRVALAKPYAEALEVLVKGKGDRHYEDYLGIGQFSELSGEYSRAKWFYEQVLDSLDSDKKVDTKDPKWAHIYENTQIALIRVTNSINNAAEISHELR